MLGCCEVHVRTGLRRQYKRSWVSTRRQIVHTSRKMEGHRQYEFECAVQRQGSEIEKLPRAHFLPGHNDRNCNRRCNGDF
jgi:hypothetical protein